MPSDAKKKRAAAKKEAAKKRGQPPKEKKEETNGVNGACAGTYHIRWCVDLLSHFIINLRMCNVSS